MPLKIWEQPGQGASPEHPELRWPLHRQWKQWGNAAQQAAGGLFQLTWEPWTGKPSGTGAGAQFSGSFVFSVGQRTADQRLSVSFVLGH